eukprot:CAMPEP_0196808958 /NCGR_PEP_ID=MMETSP1362-20130617/8928_1 /TAXON_ID=163516 /ORGANISM="Leptocylindrus danicus, Strain CCMP1856" /LENGTH=1553 /DNA_ID=CAMNT_0042183479 /DNA_START=42 /DNA_END=4703 /DNA_ORIENTATION=-
MPEVLDFTSLTTKHYKPAKITQITPREALKPLKTSSRCKAGTSPTVKQSACAAAHVHPPVPQTGALVLQQQQQQQYCSNVHNAQIQREWEEMEMSELKRRSEEISGQRRDAAMLASRLLQVASSTVQNREDEFHTSRFVERCDIIDTTTPKATKRTITNNFVNEPAYHELTLRDWEKDINWEGAANTLNNSASSNNPIGINKLNATANNNTTAIATSNNNNNNNSSIKHKPLPPLTNVLETRFNSELIEDWSDRISWLGADADPAYNEALAREIPLLLDATVAGNSLKSNIYQSSKMSFAENIIFSDRLKKEMSSTGSAATNMGGAVHTFVSTATPLHASQEELAEIIAEKQEKRAKMAIEKASRVTDAMKDLDLGAGKGRTITSSLMGPGGTERTGRPTRHMGVSSHYDTELVEHLDIVYNHVFVRPDLRRSEMRQFHRPRLTWQLARANRPWLFQIKASEFGSALPGAVNGASGGMSGMGGYMTAHNASMSGNMMNMSMGISPNMSQIRTKADLSPADGQLVLFEYSEERPALILSKGMACKIVNFYRGDPAQCPLSAGGGARPVKKKKKPKKKANDAKATMEHAQLEVEKPAKLMGPQCLESSSSLSDGARTKTAASLQELLGLTQKQKPASSLSDKQNADEAEKKKNEEEEANKNIYPEGVTEILQSGVHGPFLGSVEDDATQPGVLCNLFAAPLFQHKPQSSDFLMILNKSKRSSGSNNKGSSGGENGISVMLREMPSSMFCVGQTEPRVKVFAPRTAGEKNFANPFMTYQIAKALQRSELEVEEQGLSFEDISERVFANTTIQANALRMRIKSVADYDKNTSIWRIKPVGQGDFHGVEALGRKISPEGVSAYESACAACRRLTDLGIHDLHTGSSSVTTVGAAMMYLSGAVAAAKSRYNSVNKRANVSKTSKRKGSTAYEKAAEKLKADLLELRRKHEVAKFIYEELQLAPWHTTNEFIEVHKNAQGSGMMKLTGLGDPSGLGEGFSFLREMDPKPNKASNSDGALNEQINKITGTQNDLRRLTMKQMADLLRSYGMKDPDIKKLKRWDRVHVIRDLATRDAADGMGDVDGKFFARGEKMKLSDQKEMYRQRIQEIWRRQIDALSSDPGDLLAKSSATSEAGTEDDDDDDLSSDDDFAKDLEDEMMDVRKTNEILQETTGLAGRKANQNKEMSGDARDLVALQRDLKEERAVEEGLAKKDKMKDDSAAPIIDPDRKVVRRKITRMHPDGTTTVTFKFIISQSEVDNVIAAKASASSSSKKKKSSKMSSENNASGFRAKVGHAMFEDEDDMIIDKRSIKFQITTSADGKISKRPYPPKAMPKSSRTKVNIGMLNQRASAEKKSRKRQRAADERDIYSNARIRTGTSNRRERGAARDRMPHMKFADRLKEIQLQVEKRPNVGAFLRPVDRRQIPRYYEVISQPIDLSTIRNKNTQCEYRTVDAFIDEFELMKNNAIKFNGPTSFLAKEATAIYDFVKNQIEMAREEFHELEVAVKEQLSGTKKKKSRGGSKKKEKKSSTAASSNTANVVVNGVATTVDLGDIGDFGDSD